MAGGRKFRTKGQWIAVQAGRKGKDRIPVRVINIPGIVGFRLQAFCRKCGQRHSLYQHSAEAITGLY